jgi:tripartite motif-containing protein 71
MDRAVRRCGLRVAASLAALFLMSFLAACKKKEVASEGLPAAAPETSAETSRGAAQPKPGPELSAQVTLKMGAASGLRNPRGIAVDGAGNVYVVDVGNDRIVKFDASGKELLTFGKKGSGPEQFLQAWVAAISPQGNLLVLDSETSWIQVFAPSGKFLNRVGGDIGFYHPKGMAILPNGTVAVADTGGNRIVLIGPDGKLQGSPWKSAGNQPFVQPTDVYADSRGGLHVYQGASAKTPSLIFHLGPTGELASKWIAPEAPSTSDTPRAALAPDGRVYVTVPQNQQVRLYEADGASYHVIRMEGSEAAPLRVVSGIAVDAQGHAFVTDSGANVIYRFQLAAPR